MKAVRRGARARLAAIPFAALALVVALGPATANGAPKPRAGSWSGKVEAFSISFRVSADRAQVTALKTNYENTLCSGVPPSPDPEKVSFKTMKIHGSHFSGSARDGEEKLRGTFKSATEAAGVITERFKVPGNPDPCTGEARFTAKLGGTG
jgi:hypothetical protein